MSAASQSPAGHCRVVGSTKFSATVSAKTICAEVEQAVAARARGAPYSVQIAILSRSRLTATLVVNGRILPAQNFAVMDGNLSEESIKRFASLLAAAVAKAAAAEGEHSASER